MREEKKAVVRRYYSEVVNGRDLDAIDRIFAPDFINHDPAPGVTDFREGLKAMFRGLFTAFPDLHFTIEELLVSGDKVMDRGRARGTHLGPLGDAAPTGRSFTMREMHIYTVRGNQITERWSVTDALGMRRDLGLL